MLRTNDSHQRPHPRSHPRTEAPRFLHLRPLHLLQPNRLPLRRAQYRLRRRQLLRRAPLPWLCRLGLPIHRLLRRLQLRRPRSRRRRRVRPQQHHAIPQRRVREARHLHAHRRAERAQQPTAVVARRHLARSRALWLPSASACTMPCRLQPEPRRQHVQLADGAGLYIPELFGAESAGGVCVSCGI